MDNVVVGNFIACLRTQKGWTQTQLASLLNVSNKTVSKWENGRGFPDVSMFPIIANIFDITIEELMQGYKNVIEEKAEIPNLSEMDYNEILSAMSVEQHKLLKKEILKSTMLKTLSLISKVVLIIVLICMIVAVSLIGSGVITIYSHVIVMPKADNFECKFFTTVTREDLKPEYTLKNSRISLSFDFAVGTNNNRSYKVSTAKLKNGNYLMRTYYYEIKSEEETKYFAPTTSMQQEYIIHGANDYQNIIVNLEKAGIYEITGYCMFEINGTPYKFSDSITVKVNSIGDNFGDFEAEYADVPRCKFSGYKSDEVKMYYGDYIVSQSNLYGVTSSEFEEYINTFTEKGYLYHIVFGKKNNQHILTNGQYKVFLFYHAEKAVPYMGRYMAVL